MRIEQVGTNRLQYYDRNPAYKKLFFILDAVAPHAPTTRDTYTPPANRKARLASVSLRIRRRTAAVAPTLARMRVKVDSGAAGFHYPFFVQLESNIVDDVELISNGEWGDLPLGETISIETSDGSNGGTVDYVGMVGITEYDS